MNATLTATKARTQFFNIIEAAEIPGRSFTITVGGEPKVVMMSVSDFEGWQETLEIMSDKALIKGIKQGFADMKKGKLYTEEEVKSKLKIT